MGGRKSPNSRDGSREQSKKQPRGFARGHGAHHRHVSGKDAPRRIGTGRDRTDGAARLKNFTMLDDDAQADLNKTQKSAEVEKSLQELGGASSYGARMEGDRASGMVVEVRKGNFLTRITSAAPEAYAGSPQQNWKQGTIIRTIVRGMLQQFDLGLSSLVAPGDEIEMVIPPLSSENELFKHDVHAVLTKVHPRRNEFRRLHPSGRAIQTLACNTDRVYVVASAAEPDFRPGFVDRVLVCAAASGIPAALILNKIDLGVRERDEELLNVYRGLGVPVFTISVRALLDPTSADELSRAEVARLIDHLAGSRSVLTGHSGVGKSTLLRALDPSLDESVVRTGEVSSQTSKGTHTTTHARLFELALSGGRNAEIVDTPGVREFTPADTDRRNLWGWFPEIAKLQGQCTYTNCTHTIEKGCAVLAAAERGEIHPRRHQSYVKIYQTMPV